MTTTISLRDFSPSDTDRLVELANNKNVARYLIYTFPNPYTREAAQWWINTGCKEGGKIAKVVEYGGEFVGAVGITPQPGWKDHTAELGYWLGESYWGKGIATAAAEQMINIAFTETSYKKLFATVLGPNAVSMRILEKLGFQREGLLKAEVHKDGHYYDIHHYALHRSNN